MTPTTHAGAARRSTTDQMGDDHAYGYDDQGQLTSVTDPLSNVTTLRLRRRRQPHLGHRRQRPHDHVRIRPPQAQDEAHAAAGAVRDVRVRRRGNQTSHTDFRGKTTAMTYDRRDRMLTQGPGRRRSARRRTRTRTSPTGMRRSSTDGSGTTTYTYDERDRLLTKAAAAGTLTYTYDATGNVATIRLVEHRTAPRSTTPGTPPTSSSPSPTTG